MISPILLIAIAVAFYVAWSLGANSETMATTIGTGIFSIKRAVLISSIFTFFGALLLGRGVAETIGKGIIPKESLLQFSLAPVIIGLAVGSWITFASWKGIPVSSTHSVLGAILGFGLAKSQPIEWLTVVKIILSAISSPFVALLLAVLFHILLMKGYLSKLDGVWERERKEILLGFMQMITAALVTFSFGANDVSKAIGILIPYFENSNLILALGASGMALGVLTFSKYVLKTVGKDVTDLIPSRGLIIELSSTIPILGFTAIAMPVSISHTLVGATIGVGLARGIKKVRIEVVKSILISWIVTIPTNMLIAALLAKILI